MEQAKALNALEPFLALSKAANSPRAASDLIIRATSAPNTFLFAELLQTPQIQALASSDAAPHLRLLEIFSYGTYQTYKQESGLPALNEAQTLKLRQLSLATMAATVSNTSSDPSAPNNLSYGALQQELELDSRQALERLVISATYAGLITATLDPAGSTVRVSAVAPLRDLAPGSIPTLLSSLRAWSDRCSAVLASLDEQVAAVKATAAAEAARKKDWDAQMAKLVEDKENDGPRVGGKMANLGRSLRSGKRGSNLMGGGGNSGFDNDEAMDVDDDDESVELPKRGSKRKA